MFFALSKLLSYFTQPIVVICLLLVGAVFVRNASWKTWLFRAGVALLLFFSNDFIANEMMTAWEVKPIAFADIKKKYEYGILLTGVTKAQMEPNDRVYFNRGADRVTHSAQLYKLGFIRKILISGGSGRLIDIGEREADDVANALVMMGVPQEDIVIENQSQNTHQSAIAVKKILTEKRINENCLLVTSGYHMRRSVACFKKVGLTVDEFSTDFISHKRTYTLDVLLIPKLDGIFTWTVMIREWVGFTAYWISGYV